MGHVNFKPAAKFAGDTSTPAHTDRQDMTLSKVPHSAAFWRQACLWLSQQDAAEYTNIRKPHSKGVYAPTNRQCAQDLPVAVKLQLPAGSFRSAIIAL